MLTLRSSHIQSVFRQRFVYRGGSVHQGLFRRDGQATKQQRPQRPQHAPYHRSIVAMSQPSKKGPEKTVKIFCSGCKTFLYKYRKGGSGALVKCWHERIVEDAAQGQLECPGCGVTFARPAMIRGRPANKFVGGKVFFQK